MRRARRRVGGPGRLAWQKGRKSRRPRRHQGGIARWEEVPGREVRPLMSMRPVQINEREGSIAGAE